MATKDEEDAEVMVLKLEDDGKDMRKVYCSQE